MSFFQEWFVRPIRNFFNTTKTPKRKSETSITEEPLRKVRRLSSSFCDISGPQGSFVRNTKTRVLNDMTASSNSVHISHWQHNNGKENFNFQFAAPTIVNYSNAMTNIANDGLGQVDFPSGDKDSHRQQKLSPTNAVSNPFKVLNPPYTSARFTSTPFTTSNVQGATSNEINSQQDSEVEYLRTVRSSSNRSATSRGNRQARQSGSSVVSVNSSCNTLMLEKTFQDYKMYSALLERQRWSSVGSLNMLAENGKAYTSRTPFSGNSSANRRDSSSVLRAQQHRTQQNTRNCMAAKNKLSVSRTREFEPSTSARRERLDDDCLVINEIPPALVPISQEKAILQDMAKEINAKYAAKFVSYKEELPLVEEQSKLLNEVNRSHEINRHEEVKKRCLAQLLRHMKISEAIEEDEIEEVPALPTLSDVMQNEIDNAFKQPDGKILVEAFNITVKGSDIKTLRGLNWLNDEVINFYMNLLIERGKDDNYPSVYAFNTFFYPKLVSSGHQSLKRWTKKVDIFQNEYILVPVHLGVHWCMSIIYLKEKVIRYFDSMNGRNQQCLDVLLKYLKEESLDKKKVEFDTTGWKKEIAEKIPQQMNGSDCGMFSCMFAEFVSRNAKITFSQNDMPYFRRKMVYEILNKRILS